MSNHFRRQLLLTYIFFTTSLLLSTKVHATASPHSTFPIHGIIKDILHWEEKTLEDEALLSSSEFLINVGMASYNDCAFAMARLGTEEGYDAYLSLLYNSISTTYVKENGVTFDEAKDWLSSCLTVLALGGDPANITNTLTGDSINLIADYTYNYASTKRLEEQGTKTIAYALMVMDSLDYIIPDNSPYTRDDLIKQLLSRQQDNGSFSSESQACDSSVTALVIQALAPFYNDSTPYQYESSGNAAKRTIRSAIKDALDFLSSKQTKLGDIKNGDSPSLESTAQTLIACTSVGIDPYEDARFIRNNQTLLHGLIRYQMADGGFTCLLLDDMIPISDQESSLLALNALVSYYRYSHQQRSLYDMRKEASKETKQLIDSLESSIMALPEHPRKDDLLSLYEKYSSLSVSDRRYVYHYEKLEHAMEGLQLRMDPLPISKEMDQLNSGTGCLYDIILNKELTITQNFTNNDYYRYCKLSDSLSLKDYSTITIFYCKLANTAASSFALSDAPSMTYEELLAEMKQKKTELETIQAKIDSINEQILTSLPSLSSVGKNQKELIDQLVYQATSIPKEDRYLIDSYDELLATKERLTPVNYIGIIGMLLVVLSLLLLLPLLFYLLRRSIIIKREEP